MNPRLLILIVVAAALAIVYAAVKSRPVSNVAPVESSLSEHEATKIQKTGETLDKKPLPGEEPPEKPSLDVRVEVDRSRGKNRLYFTISEAHGYYVEQFQIRFWYVRVGKEDSEDSPLVASNFFDQYLPAKGTLRVCLEVVPAELNLVGGDLGQSENWRAEVDWHGRARAQNPDPLPVRTDLEGICD